MNKEETKKKNADVPQLHDFLKQLPKDIDAKATSKGTVLRHKKTYIMHLSQSPKGVHSFIRTKTGQRLQSKYSTNNKEIDALLQEINDKTKKQEETKSSSSQSKK